MGNASEKLKPTHSNPAANEPAEVEQEPSFFVFNSLPSLGVWKRKYKIYSS